MERIHAAIEVVLVVVDVDMSMAKFCGGKMRTLVFYGVLALSGDGLAHELTTTVTIKYNHTWPSRGRGAH